MTEFVRLSTLHPHLPEATRALLKSLPVTKKGRDPHTICLTLRLNGHTEDIRLPIHTGIVKNGVLQPADKENVKNAPSLKLALFHAFIVAQAHGTDLGLEVKKVDAQRAMSALKEGLEAKKEHLGAVLTEVQAGLDLLNEAQ